MQDTFADRTAVMEAFAQIDMFEISSIMYEFLGETKPVASKQLILFRIFNYSILVLVLTYIFLNFFYVEGEYYVKLLQPFFSYLQASLKYVLLTTQITAVRNVLRNILTKFWNYRCFDRRTRIDISKIHKTVRYIQTTIAVLTIIGLFSYLVRPILLSNAVFPLESYVPESEVMIAVIASSQFYSFLIVLPSLLAYDFVYVSCCIHIILQVRLLKVKFKEALDNYQKKPKQRLCCYIKHHQFLYSMFRRLRNIFSAMLLFHYLVTLISFSFVLLQLLLRDMDAISYASQILTILFYIAQFALYTFPAEEVTFEFLDLPNAIYLSKWYKNEVEIQKLILYVILKSQQHTYFTGAGLVDINVETFDSVLRKALSFCAIFKNLLKN